MLATVVVEVMVLMVARDGAAPGPLLVCLLPSCSDSRCAPARVRRCDGADCVQPAPQHAGFSWLGLGCVGVLGRKEVRGQLD